MRLLFAILPEEAFVLVIALTGIGLIVGLISRGAALSIVGSICALLLLAPFIDSLVAMLPLWLLLAALGVMAFSLVRALLEAMIGKGASDHVVGSFVYDFLRFGFRTAWFLLLAPFHIVLWMLRLNRP